MDHRALVELIASISGMSIDEKDYIGYFTNEHGESLVFVQRPEEPNAVLLHSDMDWQPEQIHPDTVGFGVQEATTSSPLARVPVAGNVILDRSEVLWLIACLEASAWLRSDLAPQRHDDGSDREQQ